MNNTCRKCRLSFKMFVYVFLIFPLISQTFSAYNFSGVSEIENWLLHSHPVVNRTSQCDEELSLITQFDQNTLLKMLDASSKIPPSGSLNGNFYDLGDFNECYELKSNITAKTIRGKYCLGTLPSSSDLIATKTRAMQFLHPIVDPRLSIIGFHWAVCIPSGCTAQDFFTGLNFLHEEWCYSKENEPELDTGAWITIGVLIFFLVLVVLSTIFDVYWYYAEKAEAPRDIFIAFSALTNGRKLIAASNSSDQLSCLNGIKAFSMMWVVLGHEYFIGLAAPFYNFKDFNQFRKQPAHMYMMSATFSVDSFFVVGGLVTVYGFLKAMDKGVKFNIFLFYLHRYLRLTPAFFIVVLIHMYLLKYLGNGPIWNNVDLTLGIGCRDSWWAAVTYLQNYFLGDHGICVPQTWYLSVDMQLFVLSPLILVPLKKWPKLALGGIGFLTIASMAISFAIGYSYELPGFVTSQVGSPQSFTQNYYFPPWTRFGPYVMGMGLGYFIYIMKKNGKRLNLKPWQVLGLWASSLAIMLAIVWLPYDLCINEDRDFESYKLSSAFFLGYHRHVWAAGLCFVIFLCVSGHGGPIDAFLSHPVFHFLTKLSYVVYLTHYSVISVRYSGTKTTMEFSAFNMLRDFWGDFVLSLAAGLVLSLMFESPIITLEKIIFQGKESKPLPK